MFVMQVYIEKLYNPDILVEIKFFYEVFVMSFVFINRDFAIQTKERIANQQGFWENIRFELRKNAEEAMQKGPWSVTYHKGKAVSGNPHDYYSEAPYWWPNPENPNGPFIRRDGEYYPNRFVNHRDQMEHMAETVLLLALAGYYLDEPRYIERAVYLIRVWFLDEATKMNPHLEYAQAIFGVCDGRGIGIIDTNVLIKVIHGAGYINECGKHENEIEDLKKWFADYLHWMNTSEKGLEEKHYFNNHANWWNVQAAAFAAFTGNESLLNECFEKYKTDILPNQLSVEGSFTDELTRTRSYTYSLFNLEACTLTCEIAFHKGVDLWHFQTGDGKSIQKAIDFMLPYIENPFLWSCPQIAGDHIHDHISLQLGGVRLQTPEYHRVNQIRGKDFRFIRNASFIGPLCFLSGFSV